MLLKLWSTNKISVARALVIECQAGIWRQVMMQEKHML